MYDTYAHTYRSQDFGPETGHDECSSCWICPDCSARWCIDFNDSSHSCGQDDLDGDNR